MSGLIEHAAREFLCVLRLVLRYRLGFELILMLVTSIFTFVTPPSLIQSLKTEAAFHVNNNNDDAIPVISKESKPSIIDDNTEKKLTEASYLL